MIDEISLFYWSWIYIKSFAGNIILLHRAIMTTNQNRRLWLVDWLINLFIDWLIVFCFASRMRTFHSNSDVTLHDKPGLRRIYFAPDSNGMRSVKRDITISNGTSLNRKIHNALFKTIHVIYVDICTWVNMHVQMYVECVCI